MNDALKRLAPLIAVVQLQRIRLVESSCRAFSQDLQSGEINVRLNWAARSILRSPGNFSVLADIEALLVPSVGAEADAARIWARLELRYVVPEGFELNEGLLEEFAKANGVFNAWPYWREFVQNTLLRMELPAIVMPLLKVQKEQTRSAATARPARG